ncbi:MAG: hypothetical protein F4239_06340, partial [Gammaproteobacteria bacterium]|nr:hypothetical protein [Gammaproteobacteria bacterium]
AVTAASVAVTVTDDEGEPGVTLSVSPYEIDEDSGRTEITVTATIDDNTRFATNQQISSSVGTASDSAVEGTDYETVSDFVITIGKGEESGSNTFFLTPVDDKFDESNETISVIGSSSTILSITGTAITIVDDDEPPTLSVSDASADEGSDLTFTITRSGDVSGVSTVQWQTGDDERADANSATAGSDYTAVTSARTITFAATETAKTITVSSLTDDDIEGPETFVMRLSDPSGATIADGEGIGAISDRTALISVSDASAEEGTLIQFTVTRTGNLQNVVSLNWFTNIYIGDADAATPDIDYQAVLSTDPSSISFEAGESQKTINVETVEDNIFEPDELFVLRLVNSNNATITDDEAIGTIVNDDEPPLITINDVEVPEGQTAYFEVSLFAVQSFDVTVLMNTIDDSAIGGLDYVRKKQKVTISAGSRSTTFAVETMSDSIDEPDEIFMVELTTFGDADTVRKMGVGTIKDINEPLIEEILPRVNAALMRMNIWQTTNCIEQTISGMSKDGGILSLLQQNATDPNSTTSDKRNWQEKLDQARLGFQLAADENSPQTGDLTICAGADLWEMDGPDSNTVSWEGSLFGTYVGANVRTSHDSVFGLDISRVTGLFEWTETVEDRQIMSETDLEIDSVHPYAAWTGSHGERIWALGSVGSGTLDIRNVGLTRHQAKIDHLGVAFGAKWPLDTNDDSVPRRTYLFGETWYSEMGVQETDYIRGGTLANWGFRGLIQHERNHQFESGIRFSPQVDIGISHENAVGGTGAEARIRLEWQNPSHEFKTILSGRLLVVEDGYSERGLGLDFSYSPEDKLGLLFQTEIQYGDTDIKNVQLLDRGVDGIVREPASGIPVTFDMEVGWVYWSIASAGTATVFCGFTLSSN